MRLNWLMNLVLLAFAASLFAGTALAADPHAAPAGDDGPFATKGALDLAIWTVVVFLVLFLVLRAFAWKPMLAGLQKREESIRGALEEAEKARAEAQQIRASLQKDMDQAHHRVKEIIDEAKRDAERTAADTVAKAKADIALERERLHREIQNETDAALQSLWTRAAELATQVSAKVIRRQLDGEAQRRLIDEALSELKTVGGANGHA
jgi:F-type H+-transporting ATPase subunit b